MAARITQEQIIEINEAYAELGTYAAVARLVGVSAGTVKKYVQKDYIKKEDLTFTKFDMSKLKDVEDYIPTEMILLPSALNLSEEEIIEIKEFTKELSI